jgi:hypothetical protein
MVPKVAFGVIRDRWSRSCQPGSAPARRAAAVGCCGIIWRVFTAAGLPPVKISGE